MMAINKPVFLIVVGLVSIVVSSVEAVAQSRPNAQWSNFDKKASGCACHLFARDALQREGLTILEDAGSVLIADNAQVIAEVACKPGEQQIFVSAFSSDSAIAERVRNNVRASIVKSALFDTCP
jgi:hypothetical protein